MKKRISFMLMALVAMSMFFGACKKDNADLILGTWNINGDKTYAIEAYDDMADTAYLSDEQGALASLTFYADGNAIAKTTGENGNEETMSFTYTVNENALVWNIDGEAMSFTIDKLTKKELIFGSIEQQEFDGHVMKMTIHFEMYK